MSLTSILAGLIPAGNLLEYLQSQREDYRKWFAYHLRGCKPEELTASEVAAEEASWQATCDTLLHGSPPD